MTRYSIKGAAGSLLAGATVVAMLVISPLSAPVHASVADEFDELREKHVTMLTGGTTYDVADPEIAARLAQIASTAQQSWDTMLKSPTRNRLWNDSPFGNDSASFTRTYEHLKGMALAYSTHGSSLEGNALLRADIIDGLDWMNANRFYDGVVAYQNWWHWQIGAPLALNDLVALMYDELTATQISDNMAAISYTQPSATMSGANRLWESQVIAISGINNKDSARVAAGRDGVSALFPYVTAGDGFYTDGSFVQHNFYAYNGGYGLSLVVGLADVMYLLDGSTWEVTDPNHVNTFRWIAEAYEPFIYQGNLMDMVRGREISRHSMQDLDAGVDVMSGIIRLAAIAPSADAEAFESMIKQLLQLDTDGTFFGAVSVDLIIAAKAILSDSSVTARGDLTAHRQFSAMDRVVHMRPGFAFGLSMFSTRIANYEAINAENNKGWHTGDGMTYLYNNDQSQYNDNFWPTVDSYRLPGTTVLNNSTQTANNRSDRTWVGGADILGLYGVTGMDLHTVGKSLEAKKSWFMFDDEIVALGAGISSTDGIATETIVENRKLNSAGSNALTVNGVSEPTTLGWAETMSGVDSAHLAGSVPGSDIGYYFPDGASVTGLREARTGNWKQINAAPGPTPSTQYTRNYLSLAVDHGTNPTDESYSYVLLPNTTSSQVGSYAAAPDITILENSESVQAVRENSLNITGINFWNNGPTTAGGVTSDSKASVMMRETGTELELSVSDPTQTNVGTIYLSVDKSVTGLIANDSRITVIQYQPTLVFKVNVNQAKGAAFSATFSLTGSQTPNPAPIPLANPYEAETLPINALTDTPSVYTDVNASGGKKLGFNNNAVADYVEFSLDVTQPGTYDIVARVGKAGNNGIYQLSVDGVSAGAAQDLWWNTAGNFRDFTLGTHTFSTAGSHTVRLTTTGKNASASGFKLVLDSLNLVPPAGGGGDATAPTVPTGLTATAASPTQIDLSWTASTDAAGVTGYRIYLDGTEVGTSTSTSFSHTGLSASTGYTYTVRAYDAAANLSQPSDAASATTTGASFTFEAETLTATSGVIKASVDASGGQYRLFNAYAVDAAVGYEVPVTTPGTYRLVIRVMRFSDTGTYQLQINGLDHGTPVDYYRSAGKFVEVDLGNVVIGSAGTHEFTFTVTGKNASASGYKLPLDAILLGPAGP